MEINLADGQLFDIVGRLISCMVSTLIIFRIFDVRYERVYPSRILYILVKSGCCVINWSLYFVNSPVINVLYWLFIILTISKVLYTDHQLKKRNYYFMNIAFFFICSMCESIGCLLVQAGVKILNIEQSDAIISFVYTVGGSISLILMYYLVLQRLFVAEKRRKTSTVQYIIYGSITAYVLVNIGSILFLLQHELGSKDYLFLLLDAVLVIVINLYLFHLLDIFSENKDLKYKLALYERQAKGNYEYYQKQIESNKKALRVIHDVRKHICVLEELKESQISAQLRGYTDSFEEMIEPLLIKQYSDNAILNIIINDKKEYCDKNGLNFVIDIQPVEIDFMKPIDITTIFGNILDNAIEACEKSVEKKISLSIYPFNGMVYTQISNSYEGSIRWNTHGRPLSMKGEGHGIGLENVEKTLQYYNGNIEFAAFDELFTVEVIISEL